MKASKSQVFRIPFVVAESDIEQAWNLIGSSGKAINCSANLTDGSSIYPETKDDLFSLPNPSSRRIYRLSLSTQWNNSIRVELTLEDSEYRPIEYSVSGEEKETVFLCDRLDQWIDSVRQPHGAIAITTSKTNLIEGILFGAGITSVAFGIGTALNEWPNGSTSLLLGAILLALPPLLRKLWGELYPPGVFLIGSEKSRFNRILEWRKRLSITAIGIAILVGIIRSWIIK
jgi:hypothetical protein